MNIETSVSGLSNRAEKRSEQEMMGAVKRTLDLSQEVPFGTDPNTGIDVRNGGLEGDSRLNIIPKYGDRKNALAVYPAEGDDTTKMYFRSMSTGGTREGKSIRAYVDRDRSGRRKGQEISVTTDYFSEPAKTGAGRNRSKGSKTTLTVYDSEGNVIREREHKSSGVGLSPLVAKIVTHGIEAQVQKIKDGKKQPQ